MMNNLVTILCIGIGATLVMDVWTMLLKAAGMPTLNYAFVGRWIGHWGNGTFSHAPIGKAAPVRGETLVGWFVHYAVGIVFAAALVLLYGTAWVQQPTVWPAVKVGLVTLVMPWLIMQPAFGAGIAASRTPAPWKSRLQSVATHAVFGVGMYVAAVVLQSL